MADVTYIVLNPEHVREVVRLERMCTSSVWSERQFVDAFKARLKGVGCEREGELIGYCTAYQIADEMEIVQLCVHPQHRNRGVGASLVGRLLQKGRDEGITTVYLEVSEVNDAAFRLYSRHGFRPAGKRRAYYPDGTDAVTMRCELDHEQKGGKSMRSLYDIDMRGKKVLVRVDHNVPLDGKTITDDTRIRASLPTLLYCLEQGAALICCTHLGKPKGKADPALSLAPVAERLSKLLEKEVVLAGDVVGPDAQAKAEALAPGKILMLENLRFEPGETKNDEAFSKALADMADVCLDDAFGVAHRAHASVVGVMRFAKECGAGKLLLTEYQTLSKALEDPDRPFVAVTGGAKVSSKLKVLNHLLDRVDNLIIGGAMANTFLKAQGYEVGTSLWEDDLLSAALDILEKAKKKGIGCYLPVDFITGTDVKAEQASALRPFQNMRKDEMALDTGPATHALFAQVLKDAKTVVWNGPLGAFENPAFSQGSVGLCRFIAGLKHTLTIAGGGDTDALIHLCKNAEDFSFISTGGGSFLEFIQGDTLPAFKALEECSSK